MTTVDDRRWALFLGPDKSGSTWLQRFAASHPDIGVPAAGGLFFFDRFHTRGLDWYLHQFPEGDATVWLEICHDYLFAPEAPARVAAALGAPRLVVSARDPVERAVSSWHDLRRQGRTRLRFDEALRTIDELVEHGAYARHLEPWIDQFGTQAVTLLDFAQLRRDAQGFADAFCQAIGVPVHPLADGLRLPLRTRVSVRSHVAARTGKQLAVLLRRLRLERIVVRLRDARRVQRVLYRDAARAELVQATPADRALVRERLAGDTARLDAWFGTSFSASWWG